jgi:hypothetical protein
MPIYRDKIELYGVPQVTGTVAVEGVTAVGGNLPISGTVSVSGITSITGTVGISGTPTVSLASNIVTASIDGTPTVSVSGTTLVQFTAPQSIVLTNATSSYEGQTLVNVNLTGSSVLPSGGREALITYLTGSEPISISSLPSISGTVNIQGVTVVSGNLPITGAVDTGFDAYSLPNSQQAILVKLTGSTTSVDAQYVTGTVSIGVETYGLGGGGKALVVKTTGSSESDRTWVTGSVEVTSLPQVSITGTPTVYVTGTVSASIQTSDNNPIVVKQKTGTDTIRSSFSVFSGDINWASTGSSNVSGTFILANSSSTRAALMFANNTSLNLYVALGDNDNSDKNGFGMNSTGSAPYSFSFILFPSGTYFAEPNFVGVKHSGFFVSSSAAADASVSVYRVE